jgi:hypothetical protein
MKEIVYHICEENTKSNEKYKNYGISGLFLAFRKHLLSTRKDPNYASLVASVCLRIGLGRNSNLQTNSKRK